MNIAPKPRLSLWDLPSEDFPLASRSSSVSSLYTNIPVFQNNQRVPTKNRLIIEDFFVDTVTVENTSIVAQIVGKGGEKIQSLAAHYDCEVVSPHSGREPVFVIFGSKKNVLELKEQIACAAAHFSNLAKAETSRINSVKNNPNCITVTLHIPEQYMGLVIGCFGRTIRKIQDRFQIYVSSVIDRRSSTLDFTGLEGNLKNALCYIVYLLTTKTQRRFTYQFIESTSQVIYKMV